MSAGFSRATACRLIIKALADKISRVPSDNFRFSAVVAGFAMLLRDSEYRGALMYGSVLDIARRAKGTDQNGYRAEFLKMIEKAELLESTQG
jgi:Ca-activated chloride channel family protein